MRKLAGLFLFLIAFAGVGMAQVNLAALQTEILSDPMNYGYADMFTQGGIDTPQLAAMLNTPRTGADGFPSITVRNPSLLARDVLEKAIDIADFKANPTAVDAALFQATLALGEMALIDATGADTFVFSNLKKFFGSSTATRARLNGLANRFGSRAEQLFGPGVTISIQQVIDAIRL